MNNLGFEKLPPRGPELVDMGGVIEVIRKQRSAAIIAIVREVAITATPWVIGIILQNNQPKGHDFLMNITKVNGIVTMARAKSAIIKLTSRR